MPASDTHTADRRGHHTWWLAAASAALVIGGVVAFYGQSPEPQPREMAAPEASTSPAHTVQKVRDAVPAPRVKGMPIRVAIPSLSVHAPVLPIETQGSTLIPPSDPQQLGWWASGALPGARRGSVLITGHTVHTGGGALDDLETLQRGEPVRVRTAHGWIRYDVQRVHVYSKGELAADAERLFSQQAPGRLVLITCEDWDGSAYLSNVVVTAAPSR